MQLGDEIASPDDIFNTLVLSFKKSDALNEKTPYEVTSNELDQTRQDLLVRRALEDAIEQDIMEVYLQPLFDASNDRIAGAEALSRVKGMDGKILSPGLFIPTAERRCLLGFFS